MIIKLKHFYGSLNIVVISAPGHEGFSTKCAQCSFIFTELENFSFGAVIFQFWDKPYVDVNIKNHLNSALICK